MILKLFNEGVRMTSSGWGFRLMMMLTGLSERRHMS